MLALLVVDVDLEIEKFVAQELAHASLYATNRSVGLEGAVLDVEERGETSDNRWSTAVSIHSITVLN